MAKIRVTLTAERTYNITKKGLETYYPELTIQEALDEDCKFYKDFPRDFFDEPRVKITIVGEVV